MRRAGLVSLALEVLVAVQPSAQSAAPPAQVAPPAGQTPSVATAAEVQAAIDKLGSFEFPTRTEAARVVRRAPAEIAVRLLAAAARSHADEYVRYRALTLLSGFGGPVAAVVMT